MKKTTTILVIVLALTMLMAGCGGKASIVGRWQSEDGNYIVEFYENGDASLDGDIYRYEIMSDSKIKFQENPLSNPEVLEYKLSGKTLEIGGMVFTKQ